MLTRSTIDALRSFLQRLLTNLDKIESKPARSRTRAWYKIEYHLPPVIVAIVSAIFLFSALVWGQEISIPQTIAYAVFSIVVVVLVSVYLVKSHSKLAEDDDAMALLAVVSFITIAFIKIIQIVSPQYTWLSVYATPVSICSILLALLLNARIAIVMSFTMSLLFGVINGFSLELALMSSIGCMAAVGMGVRARTTNHLIRTSFVVGLVQSILVLFIGLSLAWTFNPIWTEMVAAFVGGIVAAFFCLGALPYLESFFSRLSNIRLLELGDANHPLLKKLSLEAPGTYHHSLLVASLAENAANAIGANGLLCRVGAYFHDIGKTVKAEYFVENQGKFGNPHDQVSPSLSRLIITSHVKEGIALAKEYKLDPQIIDFIPQHHGTSRIEYFYHKALKQEESEEEWDQEKVSVEAYRYPGPKPQSRETGIVMMADSVEAASRTIEEPSHQRFKDLVYKIINKKLVDGQLSETPLTFNDLHRIGERFTSTLMSIYHDRVPYPEATEPSQITSPDEITPADQS